MAFWTGLVPGIGESAPSASHSNAPHKFGGTDFPSAGPLSVQAASDYWAIVGEKDREAPMEKARWHFFFFFKSISLWMPKSIRRAAAVLIAFNNGSKGEKGYEDGAEHIS